MLVCARQGSSMSAFREYDMRCISYYSIAARRDHSKGNCYKRNRLIRGLFTVSESDSLSL